MDSAREVLIALARRYSFGDVGALAPGVLHDRTRAALVASVCEFGHRLLALDAEDFATDPGSRDLPDDLRRAAWACHLPQTSREQPRGVLASMRPLYSLLLEVIRIRWEQRELSSMIAGVHMASEYLPLLAFEPELGHGGDPARWPAGLRAKGSRFGVIGDRECSHTNSEKSAAERTLRVAGEPGEGWRAYLDRQHSQVAGALATCVARCRNPCTAMDWVSDRHGLVERCRVALEFADTPLVRLRHAAPVGHGFGEPSPEELLEAWERSRAHLSRNGLGSRAMTDDGYPLAGLPSLISAVAAAEIRPATLLSDVAAQVVTLLS